MNLIQIIIDEINWESFIGPTHILGYNGKDISFIPIYVGMPMANDNEVLDVHEYGIGLFIKSEDYAKVDHDKIYIIFHNPYISLEWFNENEISQLIDMLTTSSSKTVYREHIHMAPNEWIINNSTKKGEN